MKLLHVACLSFLCLTLGCSAQHQLSRRGAIALITVGTLVTTVGILTMAGCADPSGDTGCGSQPAAPDLAGGIPLTAAGIGMITAGALARPRLSNAARKATMGKTAPMPKPVLPDPFVQPIMVP
jgi:hypothetical protein